MPKRNSGELRLRVFAGPNGSGKSTVIRHVRDLIIDGKHIDFGHYINADDIATNLRKGCQSLADFDISSSRKEFITIASASGLINTSFPIEEFKASFSFSAKRGIVVKDMRFIEQLAQIIADFLRKKLLAAKEKFSFETVFSHPSKLDIMREAVAAGYKVYLYFVSTESPEINKFRVKSRVAQHGHDVPPDKIESRYFRSLDLLYDAAQLAYKAYFFDNSVEGGSSTLFADFEQLSGKKTWNVPSEVNVPIWFRRYYAQKIP